MTQPTVLGADVTVYFLVTSGALARLGTVLERIGSDPVLAPISVVLLCSAEDESTVRQASAGSEVRLLVLEATNRSVAVSAVLADLPHLETSAFAAVRLPKADELSALAAELERASGSGPTGPATGPRRAPRLLDVEQTLPTLARAWVAARVAAGEHPVGDVDALTALDVTSGARLESVDPVPGAVWVGVWLNAGLPPGLPEPAWRFEVVLLGPDGVVAASEPSPLRQRTDRFGATRWDEVRAELRLDGVPDGDHVLGLRQVTETGADATVTPLPARQGPLLSARTTLVPSGEGGREPVRVLVHSPLRGRGACLLVQRGDGALARRRWDLRLLRLDADFVLRHRRSSRMRMLRLARLVTGPWFARRDVWLIGERPDTAQDNGMHLFTHLRRTEPEREVYYVIDPGSSQIERVRGLGNVIDHSSPRHRLLMLHARVLANAYSIHHMLPRQWDAGQYARHLAWRVGALRVYLKHGVHLSPNAVKRGSAGYDLFLTATRRETEAIREVTGYDAELAMTGLPRYDALTPTPASRTVLFMSTWRRYLVPRLFAKDDTSSDPFEGSSYEAFVGGLLASERLRDMLQRYDYRLEFLPHYHLAGPVSALPTADERITIADPDGMSIQEQLRRCDAFITDYSSVHFDVAYMGTPVVYARFDEEEFETRHASASWFDYDVEGFGPVARTLDETLDALEHTLARGCVVESTYAERADAAFGYRDAHNCDRVVEAIVRRCAEIR